MTTDDEAEIQYFVLTMHVAEVKHLHQSGQSGTIKHLNWSLMRDSNEKLGSLVSQIGVGHVLLDHLTRGRNKTLPHDGTDGIGDDIDQEIKADHDWI